MVKKRGSVTLYNLIFPLWMAIYVPPLTLIPLLGNLLIDGAIITTILKRNEVQWDRKRRGKLILIAWALGFLADFIGMAMILGLERLLIELANPAQSSVILAYGVDGWLSAIILLLIVLFIGYLIYMFNRALARKMGLEEPIAQQLGFWMGLITAPWLFLVPMSWFYW